MASKALPTVGQLRQLLDYNPVTGVATWRPRSAAMFVSRGERGVEGCAANWNAQHAGKEAGSLTRGYKYVRLYNVSYPLHRVVYAIANGHPPIGQIDHINGDRLDNRIDNLRDVTNSVNSKNRGLRRNNKTGVAGVFNDGKSKRNPWTAAIRVDGTLFFLGRHPSFEDAAKARKAAEAKYGYHANHGTRLAVPKQ